MQCTQGQKVPAHCWKNTLNTEQARESFDYMIENTGADFVILAPGGLQDTAHSEEICYSSNATFLYL